MKRNRARERGFTEESGQWYSNGNHIQQLILFNGRPSFQRPIDLTYGSGSARRSELLHRFFNWNNNGSIRLMAHVYAHRREMETTKSSDSTLKLIELLLFTPLYSALLRSTPLCPRPVAALLIRRQLKRLKNRLSSCIQSISVAFSGDGVGRLSVDVTIDTRYQTLSMLPTMLLIYGARPS